MVWKRTAVEMSIRMKSSNNKGDRVSNGRLLSSNEAFSNVTMLHTVELLIKRFHGNYCIYIFKTQAVAKTKSTY